MTGKDGTPDTAVGWAVGLGAIVGAGFVKGSSRLTLTAKAKNKGRNIECDF